MGRPSPTARSSSTASFIPDALPEDATPGTLRRIAEVFRGARVAERW